MARFIHLVSLTTLLGGCGSAVYRAPALTSLDVSNVGVPVMLSEVATPDPGRAFTVSGGTAAVSQSWGVGNNQTVTVTTVSQSDLDTRTRFMANVARTDRWVQVRAVAWVGRDFSMPYHSEAERALLVDGAAHR
ncbi:MAG: hypothetical protein HYY06_32060 [Deltaproteobacteria bacterium]|nr:hypothetical protein [Deltaproteobacteria bacterium]